MKNRRFVKLRVDMYSDTKFKIIDTMEDRDLIHYIWTRLITLCGKVNLNGDLYMSKTIPYTTETLAIEFNRSVEKVKLALKVFIDLEMIKISEDNVYKVSNFAKHQNIKVQDSMDKKEVEEINKEKKKESEINSDNIIEEGEVFTNDNNLKEKNNKNVNSGGKLEVDNKGKIINFENKCSDPISSDGYYLLSTDKKKKCRKFRKITKDEEKLVSIDVEEEDDISFWDDEKIILGDLVEEFSF